LRARPFNPAWQGRFRRLTTFNAREARSTAQASARGRRAREEHALGDIRLVELVAHFPLERRRDHEAAGELGGASGHSSSRASGRDINANSAYWLTIRSFSDGGSRKMT
jgi:hypothetical protein